MPGIRAWNQACPQGVSKSDRSFLAVHAFSTYGVCHTVLQMGAQIPTMRTDGGVDGFDL